MSSTGKTVKDIVEDLSSFAGYSKVTYTDGSIEYLTQWYSPKPGPGAFETLDVFGTRAGWQYNDGTCFPCYNYKSTSTFGTYGVATIQPIYQGAAVTITIPTVRCSKCKKEVLSTQIRERWNWDPNMPDLERRICNKCYCKIKDKEYDLDVSVDTEETLFGKSE